MEQLQTLKAGKVAIAGLGGLGSHIAVMLARSGVGKLLLVDFDVVEESNLNRQHYNRTHLGRKKTECLAEQIAAIRPDIALETIDRKVTEENAAALFQGYPVICEAFDDPGAKAMLVNCVLEHLNARIISGSGMAGFESSNLIQTRRVMKRLYLCGDGVTAVEDGKKLTAGRVQICAGHQANMAVRLLMGIEEV